MVLSRISSSQTRCVTLIEILFNVFSLNFNIDTFLWVELKWYIFASSVKSYKKEERKHCYYDKYGNYENLDDAIAACDLDSNCGKIYDESCDDAGPFYLCPKISVVLEAKKSCLYLKQNQSPRLLDNP